MRLLRPKDRIVFTFAADDDLPIDQRPQLIAKVLSVADVRRLQAIGRDRTDGISALIDSMLVSVVGWENVNHPETGEPIPFSKEAVAEWMTVDEITEAIEFVSGRLGADDRKKSEPRPSSDVASSAPRVSGDVLGSSPHNSQPRSSVPNAVGEGAASATEATTESSSVRNYTSAASW